MTSTADLTVLIAPQELKGSLTAVEAASAVAKALRAAYPGWSLDVLPMADGGPGTTAALITALGGESRQSNAFDPLMRPVEAGWGLLPGKRAVVECAAASGLLRLQEDELDPRRASSFGTGQLIAAALDAGVQELVVGLGGSATNDGGAGMAQALGFRLLDESGRDVEPGGAALARLTRIDAAGADARLADLSVLGATDVTNPLCGPTGASTVYGPQKGADAATVFELDAALGRLGAVVARDLGIDVMAAPGAGAAGGLGAGIIAFLGAELRSGAQVVGEAAGIEARVAAADVVFTGEGRLDGQTVYGKTPQYVAGLARATGKPVVCIAGSLGDGHESATALFDHVEVLSDGSGAIPSPGVAGRQVGEASLRGVEALIGRGLIAGLAG